MKKLLTFLLCLTIALMFCMTASASQLPRLVDDADLLTFGEEADIRERLDSLSEMYQIDTVIVTVMSTDGKSAQAYADDYFDYNGYGMGEGFDGVLFLVNMGEREWAVSTYGEGKELVTDRVLDSIEWDVIQYLSYGDYYGAFDEFILKCEKAYDDSYGFFEVAICLVIGVVVAFISVTVMKSQLKSVQMRDEASDYVKNGSLVVTVSNDSFLYNTVTKTRRAQSNGSGGHRSSSGRSHGGRSGRF